MRLISISQCKPGMKLGKNIYNEEGRILLSQEVELTSSLIQRLESSGIHYLYIADRRTDDIVIPDLIRPETRIRTITQIRSSFRSLMGETNRKQNPGTLAKEFRDVLHAIIDDLSGNKDAMIMLMDLNVTDLYLYQHSMNVCIYTTMVGMHAGYSRDELFTLGLGALLHDIGKTKIPLDILTKPDRLSSEEFEVMKKHAEIGFRMLKDEANIPLISAHCALQHHERLNGSGYPRGLKGTEIHEYAQWIGIADSFDAMTTHRVYRNPLLPHDAMEVLYAGADTLYDIERIKLFSDKIASYPLGVMVRINTGEAGVVVDINASSPHRPVIRILENEAGEPLDAPYEIDLSKQLSVMIVSYDHPTDK